MTGNQNIDAKRNIEQRLDQLLAWYGESDDGSAPTRAQWRAVLERPAEQPINIVNFFKLRDRAAYADGSGEPLTGQQAFDRYAAVSGPTMDKVGGRFLLLAPFETTFMGAEEDWDLVVVGSYPNTESLLALHEDADYRAVYPHRNAALARQKVLACGG